MLLCVSVVYVCVSVRMCVWVFIPAHDLPAPPAAPADVVHHTDLRTDHPLVASLSKTQIHT